MQKVYVGGADDPFRAMAWGTIEDDEQVVMGVGFGKLLKEALQTPTVHPGQVKAETLSRSRLHCRIQVGPFVGAPDDVGWAKALRTVSPPVPVDEAETCFVEGQNLQWFPAWTLAALPDGGGEVFLKASCSWGSAFSCRGLPVLSFTFRRLKS